MLLLLLLNSCNDSFFLMDVLIYLSRSSLPSSSSKKNNMSFLHVILRLHINKESNHQNQKGASWDDSERGQEWSHESLFFLNVINNININANIMLIVTTQYDEIVDTGEGERWNHFKFMQQASPKIVKNLPQFFRIYFCI